MKKQLSVHALLLGITLSSTTAITAGGIAKLAGTCAAGLATYIITAQQRAIIEAQTVIVNNQLATDTNARKIASAILNTTPEGRAFLHQELQKELKPLTASVAENKTANTGNALHTLLDKTENALKSCFDQLRNLTA